MIQVFNNETEADGFRISHILNSSPDDMKTAHIHRQYEIFYLVAGERYYFVEDRLYQVHPGSLVMIPSGCVHRTACANPDIPYERILLILEEEYIQPILGSLGMPHISALFSVPVRILSFENERDVRRIFERIFAELSEKPASYTSAIRLKIAELLLQASRCEAGPEVRQEFSLASSKKHKKVNEAIFFIKKHYTEPISLGEIADSIYVSRGHLSKLFNETTGMKITDYINIQRVNYAKSLLIGNTAISITELAEQCGFESITYFERVFRQVTGFSPTAFRRSLTSAHTTENN
ncbi:MAG: AraC family transcriptional regulator [Lachnospiraceae bacterium]|nr:AraC family transcriptional regulator [Lachnospiraceae bacterium]